MTEVLINLKKEKLITSSMFDRLRLRPKGSKAPRFYGLPKVHKEDYPLRPIVSAISSPTYNLSKFVSKMISPLVGKTDSFVKNSRDFAELVKKEKLESDEIMVSFDVKSLFTNVPVTKALDIIHQKLEQDQTLDERTPLSPSQLIVLLKICLTTTYFLYADKYYEQQEGTAMGSPVSPLVANLFMEYLEKIAIDTSLNPVRLWKRYIDDIFCILHKSTVDSFLDHLNSLSTSIKFTLEKENNNVLPFLDVLVVHDEQGRLITKVYRKNTHTNRYLSFKSNNPVNIKKSVVTCLFKRAHEISGVEELQKERKNIYEVLQLNSYPPSFISKCENLYKNREKSETTSQEENTLATAVLPYVKNLSEEVRRILRDYGIRTAFKNYPTLGSILTKVKDQIALERRNGVIYKINCACGDTYIGETGRTLEIRVKEHKRACVKADFEKSSVAEHAWLSGHYIDWDNVEVLDQENDLCRRKVKEGIEIRLTNKKLRINRDEGRDLSPEWFSIVKKIQHRRLHQSFDNVRISS